MRVRIVNFKQNRSENLRELWCTDFTQWYMQNFDAKFLKSYVKPTVFFEHLNNNLSIEK